MGRLRSSPCSSVFYSSSSLSLHLRLVLVAALAVVCCHCQQQQVRVGVILTNLSSPTDLRRRVGIQMAVEDYYAARPASRTRVDLRFRDSGGDVVGAASAAVDLIKNEQVQAIIGPQTSAEAEFVAYLGNTTRVPVLSYSATSPALSPAQTPFFVRTAANRGGAVWRPNWAAAPPWPNTCTPWPNMFRSLNPSADSRVALPVSPDSPRPPVRRRLAPRARGTSSRPRRGRALALLPGAPASASARARQPAPRPRPPAPRVPVRPSPTPAPGSPRPRDPAPGGLAPSASCCCVLPAGENRRGRAPVGIRPAPPPAASPHRRRPLQLHPAVGRMPASSGTNHKWLK